MDEPQESNNCPVINDQPAETKKRPRPPKNYYQSLIGSDDEPESKTACLSESEKLYGKIKFNVLKIPRHVQSQILRTQPSVHLQKLENTSHRHKDFNIIYNSFVLKQKPGPRSRKYTMKSENDPLDESRTGRQPKQEHRRRGRPRITQVLNKELGILSNTDPFQEPVFVAVNDAKQVDLTDPIATNNIQSGDETTESGLTNPTICRLCGIAGIQRFPLIGPKADYLNLVNLIRQYLNIEIKYDDGLPLHICPLCSQTIMAFFSFHRRTLAARDRLQAIINEKKLLSQKQGPANLPWYHDNVRATSTQKVFFEIHKNMMKTFRTTSKNDPNEIPSIDLCSDDDIKPTLINTNIEQLFGNAVKLQNNFNSHGNTELCPVQFHDIQGANVQINSESIDLKATEPVGDIRTFDTVDLNNTNLNTADKTKTLKKSKTTRKNSVRTRTKHVENNEVMLPQITSVAIPPSDTFSEVELIQNADLESLLPATKVLQTKPRQIIRIECADDEFSNNKNRFTYIVKFSLNTEIRYVITAKPTNIGINFTNIGIVPRKEVKTLYMKRGQISEVDETHSLFENVIWFWKLGIVMNIRQIVQHCADFVMDNHELFAETNTTSILESASVLQGQTASITQFTVNNSRIENPKVPENITETHAAPLQLRPLKLPTVKLLEPVQVAIPSSSGVSSSDKELQYYIFVQPNSTNNSSNLVPIQSSNVIPSIALGNANAANTTVKSVTAISNIKTLKLVNTSIQQNLKTKPLIRIMTPHLKPRFVTCSKADLLPVTKLSPENLNIVRGAVCTVNENVFLPNDTVRLKPTIATDISSSSNSNITRVAATHTAAGNFNFLKCNERIFPTNNKTDVGNEVEYLSEEDYDSTDILSVNDEAII